MYATNLTITEQIATMGGRLDIYTPTVFVYVHAVGTEGPCVHYTHMNSF